MSIKHINQLIRESNTSGSIAKGRPTLISVTGKADNIIFTDLVATQVTNTPNAAVYGLSVYNVGQDKTGKKVEVDIYHDPGTATGELNVSQGLQLPEYDPAKAYTKGERFQVQSKGLVFEATTDVTYSTIEGDDDYDKLMNAIVQAKTRILTDAIPYGTDNKEMASVEFTLRKWDLEIAARKLKVMISQELVTDMQNSDFDGDAVIDDIIASSIAMDINKDIIQKLINVSNRFEDDFFVKNGIADLSGPNKPVVEKGRELYALICLAGSRIYERTTYSATYVVCSPKVFSILCGSGWVRPLEESVDGTNSTLSGVMNNGMKIYVDRFPLFDYFVVGCKHEREGLETVGSLYYSPYAENDGAGFVTIVTPPSDFQPYVGVVARYALSINNIYSNLTKDERDSVNADDWSELMGKSEASQFVRVKF